MKKFHKKIMAFAMAATVMMSSSVTVFADEVFYGNAVGGGEYVGSENTEVFDVVLPTNAEGAFNFTLDPQKLLYATGAKDTEATLYFGNKATNSEELAITNKSSIGVDVAMEAKMSNPSGLTMSANSTFAEDEAEKLLYLALVLADNDPVALTQEGKVESSTTIWAVADDKFEWKNVDGTIKKVLKDTATDEDFKTIKFHMTGASNENGNWSDIASQKKAFNPSFEVEWTITPSGDGAEDPSAPAEYNFTVGTATTINVNLGKGAKKANSITSVQYGDAATGPWSPLASNMVTINESSFTLSTTLWGSLKTQKNVTKYLQVTFDNDATAVIKLTVNPN